MFDNFLSERLLEIDTLGLRRSLKKIECTPTAKIKFNNKTLINFSSNSYLNLSQSKIILPKALQIVEKCGFSGTSSRMVSGNLLIHRQLEESLASFKEKPECLVYPSGYQTNVGVISALMSYQKEACIIMDSLSHASLWDGAKLSGSRIFVYQHCDMNSLEKILKRTQNYRLKLVITESIFSMDGDIAPMKDFTNLCQKYSAVSMLDEAHATGVFGKQGRGVSSLFGVCNKVDIITGTLSKAFALQGGFVCGSKILVDFLINKSRSFIYTTAVSPLLASMAIQSLKIIKESNGQRKHLLNISKTLKDKLVSLGFDTLNSNSQIIPIITKTIENTDKLSEKLLKNGIYAPSIKPPTVPKDKARIRISLTSGHSLEDIDYLTSVLKNIC